MSYIIPIGPYHPALEEPIHTRLVVEGEKIADAEVFVGYNHRGIEKLATERNFLQTITLVERVCGICSHSHAFTYAMAVEGINGVEVPKRGEYIRVITAELERLHSHLLWLGIAFHIIGHDSMFMHTWDVREGIMDALRRRLEHPALGYTMHDDADDTALIDYYFRHHGVSVKPEDLVFTPGVVDSLLLAVHALTGPEDKVLIQTPVYGPFYSVIRRAGREIVENPMIETASGRWEMDLDDLDKKLEGVRLMLLCSLVMGLGTSVGGEKIIKSVGMDMVKLEKYQGFSADLSAAFCLMLSSVFGIPVSTTHTKTSAIMGVGAVKRISAINFGVVRDMVLTWVFTFPGCGLISFLVAKAFISIWGI